MSHFRCSIRASRELLEIIDYTREAWGDAQAKTYLDGLEETCGLLAEYPSMGRTFSTRFPNRRRLEYGSHVIVYTRVPDGVRLDRLVHHKQLFPKAAR